MGAEQTGGRVLGRQRGGFVSQLWSCAGSVPGWLAGWDLLFPGTGAASARSPGAARTKGSRRLGNNQDQGKTEAKFQKVVDSVCLVMDTQTQEGWQRPIFILKLPLTSQTCWAVFAVEITSPSPTTHGLLKEQPLQKEKKKKKAAVALHCLQEKCQEVSGGGWDERRKLNPRENILALPVQTNAPLHCAG